MILTDLTNFLATQLSLILDTSIFIGVIPTDVQIPHVLIRTIAGGTDNQSGMSGIPIQTISKARSYKAAEDLAMSVHSVLKNKPGFDGISTINVCNVIMRPTLVNQSTDGFYNFSATYQLYGRLD